MMASDNVVYTLLRYLQHEKCCNTTKPVQISLLAAFRETDSSSNNEEQTSKEERAVSRLPPLLTAGFCMWFSPGYFISIVRCLDKYQVDR